jgi:hypothetical protein
MQRIETAINRGGKYRRGGSQARAQPLGQGSVEFAEIRQRVQDKMKEYNMLGNDKKLEEEEKKHSRTMSFAVNKVISRMITGLGE